MKDEGVKTTDLMEALKHSLGIEHPIPMCSGYYAVNWSTRQMPCENPRGHDGHCGPSVNKGKEGQTRT